MTDILKMRRLEGNQYILTAPFSLCGWEVPTGFKTDLASTPWLIQWALPHNGPYAPAAVIHDWLYTEKPISRREADWVMFTAMRTLGVPRWKRILMFVSVRLFGAKNWWLPNTGSSL